jgi:hypothetical protein
MRRWMTIPELDELYAFLSERQQVAAAHERVTAIYARIREVGDVEALRLAKGPYKKLQDEIRPTLIYAISELQPDDEIQFHLSDRGHDATAWPRDNASPVPIETTVASGKARLIEMKALNKDGIAHGFINATDADPMEHIEVCYRDYRAWDLDEVFDNVQSAIRICVQSKTKRQHQGLTLVISVPLFLLQAEEWERAAPRFAQTAPQSPCKAVFVVGRALGGGDVCYRLK